MGRESFEHFCKSFLAQRRKWLQQCFQLKRLDKETVQKASLKSPTLRTDKYTLPLVCCHSLQQGFQALPSMEYLFLFCWIVWGEHSWKTQVISAVAEKKFTFLSLLLNMFANKTLMLVTVIYNNISAFFAKHYENYCAFITLHYSSLFLTDSYLKEKNNALTCYSWGHEAWV